MSNESDIKTFRRPIPTLEELRAYASRPRLQKSEVVALIQGLLPRGKATNESYTHLDDYTDEIEKLNDAQVHQRITFPCTPRELVEAAVGEAIPLPPDFVAHVRDQISRTSRIPFVPAGTDERIHPLSRRGPRRTRRNTHIDGRDPKIEKEALALARQYVEKHGNPPPRKIINTELALRYGCSEENIDRRWRSKASWDDRDLAAARRRYRRDIQEKFD